MRIRTAVVLMLGCVAIVPLHLEAQAAATPRSYSLVEINSMIAPDMTIKIYRDGPREILLQTRPVSAGSPKGYNGGLYYDFAAHFLYVWDATDGTPNCGRQTYADSTAPAAFDIVSGTAEMMASLASAPRTAATRDSVHGMAASAFSVTDTAQHVTMRMWLADKTNYILKVTAAQNGAAPGTLLDVQSITIAKPPASAFAVPSTCK